MNGGAFIEGGSRWEDIHLKYTKLQMGRSLTRCG